MIDTNIGIHRDDYMIGIILCAVNICFIAESEADLQKLLDIVDRWCEQWRVQVNQDKSNVVHFLKQSQSRTTAQFNCGQHHLKTVDSYKYLVGCILDETLDFSVTAKVLAGAASHALGAIIYCQISQSRRTHI